MYIFLSKDKKKLCVRPSISGMPKSIKYNIIPDSWKTIIFKDLWSINVDELPDKYRNIDEINKILRLIPHREVAISKPEFLGDSCCCRCGIRLNDSRTCPICDDGEEDYF